MSDTLQNVALALELVETQFSRAIIHFADDLLQGADPAKTAACAVGIRSAAETMQRTVVEARAGISRSHAEPSGNWPPKPGASVMADRTIPDGAATLALECTYEVAALLQAIVVNCPQEFAEDVRPLVVRGLALRASSLNDVIQAMLDDDGARDQGNMRKLRRSVFGRPLSGSDLSAQGDAS